MVLHIIPDEKFTPRFLEFINKNYQDHIFIIHFAKEITFCKNLNYKNVIFFDFQKEKIAKYKNYFENSSQIIIHSIFLSFIYIYLFRNPKYIKKSSLVVWGGDVYNEHLPGSKKKKLKKKLALLIKKNVIKRIPKFMTFAFADYKYLQKWYGVNGKNYDALYPSTINKEQLEKCQLSRKKDVISIIVGNSGTSTNNHIEAFNMISRFKNENIMVYCPLSYGEKDNIEIALKKGKEIFGEKFVPLMDYYTPEKYAELLSTIDIAVYAHDRQQATGNIEILSFYGAKMYIKSNISTWEHYVTRDGRKFFDYFSIANQSFDEFVYFSNEDSENNKLYFSKIWDENYIKSLWDTMLYE